MKNQAILFVSGLALGVAGTSVAWSGLVSHSQSNTQKASAQVEECLAGWKKTTANLELLTATMLRTK